MAQRDNLRGQLGAHDSGQLGDGQDVALFHQTFLDQPQGFGLHRDLASRYRFTVGDGLVTDIHHADLALLVQMGQ